MIEICIGSACHLKGSYQVIQEFKALLEEHKIDNEVELKSSFCLGSCGEGVSVRINEVIHSVDVHQVRKFFEEYVRDSL